MTSYKTNIPCDPILQQYFQKMAAPDYTWYPPKPLYGIASEPIYLHRLTTKVATICIAINAPGSLSDYVASMFLSKTEYLLRGIFRGTGFTGELMLFSTYD